MNSDEIINSIIKPFVVKQPYEVPGEFYMSSSNKNNEEFTIGERVFFIKEHGLGVFGNVTKIDHDNARLLVRTDDMQLYSIHGDNAINLTDKNQV